MWTSAVILQLVGEGRMRLDDTVQRWLPGLLPYGSRITVRQLLSHTSGMIDSNEIVAHPYRYLAEVKSPALRAKILAISRRLGTDRAYEFSPRYWIEFAAALPLLFKPGTAYSYSSIGYDVAGLIAERVGGADLATLIRRRITQPLHLQSVWGALTGFFGSGAREPYSRAPVPLTPRSCACSCRSGIWRSAACSGSSCFVLAQPSSRSWRSSCYGISWRSFVGRQVVRS